MAYQENSTVATPEVLINHLVNFCAGAGWAVERNDLAGGSRTATLRKVGVTDYVHIYNTDSTNVRMRISVGYDPLLAPAAQPNVSGECLTALGAGAYPKAFFFASQDQVWAVVSIASSGDYRHFCFGRLEKAGAYTGGTYVDGTVWPNGNWRATWSQNSWPFRGSQPNNPARYGYLRADISDDGKANNFFSIGGNGGSDTAYGEVGDAARAAVLAVNADDNAFSGRSILHAIPLFVGRTGSQLYYSPAGVVQDVRVCSIQKFEPEQEISIGSDIWKVFPLIAKRPLNSAQGAQPTASGMHGIAVKKVA